jgi:hypothetical protein
MILYETVHLGSDACSAEKCLRFIGPARRLQIRDLTIVYKCHGLCGAYRVYEDWASVFKLLWDSWSCVRNVSVHFDPQPDSFLFQPGVGHKCHLKWDEQGDCFWRGLPELAMAHQIQFLDPAPEYFARQHAKRLGWHKKGSTGDDNGNSTFTGRLVNPNHPEEFKWVNQNNKLDASGVGVSNVTPELFHEDAWLQDEAAEQLEAPRTPSAETTPKGFLGLPLEIRREIYDLACGEWVYKPFWPDRPARWNLGFALLLVSRQVSKEAWPSLYRTFRINGGTPLRMLNSLGRNIQHVRTLEIHFSCFCPWGSRVQELNNETIYATVDPERTFSRVLPVADWYPTSAVVTRYQDEWTEVISRIQAQTAISHLAVTFFSCCRSRMSSSSWITRFTRGDQAATQQYQSCCFALEDHFLSLLANCRTPKISLAGRAPPGLALRLASPRVLEAGGDGSLSNPSAELTPTFSARGMTVKFVSKAMAAFISATEEERRGWEQRVSVDMVDENEVPWAKTTSFPSFEYDVTAPQAPHFVLVRTGTPRARWVELVQAEGVVTGLEKDMQEVVDVLLCKAWEDVAGYMDYDNDQDQEEE